MEIKSRWENRVRAALPLLHREERLYILKELPTLLDWLEERLATEVGAPTTQLLVESPAPAGENPLPQVLLEYRLLRDTLIEVLEARGPLPRDQKDLLRGAVESAMQGVASEISRLHAKARFWSEEQLRLLVENVTQFAIVMLDLEGHIVSWNPGATEITGYEAEEIIGEPISRLFTAEDIEAGIPERELATAADSDKAVDFRWRIRKDGARFWASSVLSGLRDSSGTLCGYCQLIRDTTARKLASSRRKVHLAVAEALAREDSIEAVAPVVLESMCDATGCIYGAMWQPDLESGVIRRKATWCSCLAEQQSVLLEASEFAPGVGLPGKVWATGSKIWIGDISEDSQYLSRSVRKDSQLRAAMAFPILISAEVAAVFEFFVGNIQGPDLDFLSLMDEVGGHISQFVERKRAERAAAHAQALQNAILMAALDAIVTMDRDGKVVEFNPAAEQTFGYSRGEVIGRRLFELIIPERLRSSEDQVLERYFDSGQPHLLGRRMEITAVRSNGEEFPAELAITPIPTPGPPMFAAHLRDITERKRLEEELKGRMEELADMDRRKDEFLAVMAHELRNPLGAISNALAVSGLSTEPSGRAREVAARQVEHMARLLDDLLDLARINHGKIRIQKTRFNLVELVQKTLEDHRQKLEDAHLATTFSAPLEAIHVHGDRVRLIQVTTNLLDNAIKFTDPGGSISVRILLDSSNRSATVIVSDTGIGIDQSLLPSLFRTFEQADRSLERTQGGMGLGLALVKRLVEMHGGTVSASSEGLGRGAVFTVTLPLDRRSSDRFTPDSRDVDPNLAHNVLVVEDNRDAAETLRDLLNLLGHHVEVAFDGPSAVEAAKTMSPDIVICDLGLPGMDGFQVARALRQAPQTAGARLIALSGYGQEEDLRKSREAGFDIHITKPLDPADLRRLLDDPQENFGSETTLSSEAPSVPPPGRRRPLAKECGAVHQSTEGRELPR